MTHEELESFYFRRSTELMIPLKKIDLLIKLHLKDARLSDFSYNNKDRIPTDGGFNPTENLRNHIQYETLIKIEKLNLITEKLSNYVDIEN